MTRQTQSGPTSVTSEETQRSTGEQALALNVAAAEGITDAVRTTLGPRGMDKLLVDGSGDVVVTNDGATLLSEMDVSHPVARSLIQVATTQEAEVGDGTTSAVVLAGALLQEALDLVDDGVHPTTVATGYWMAADVASEALDEMARGVGPDDVPALERVAATAMTGKGAEQARDQLASVVVQAVRAALAENGRVNDDSLVLRAFPTRSLSDSQFVPGLLFDYNPCHRGMPRSQTDADVLVYDGAVETAELSNDGGATVTDFGEYQSFVDREHAELDAAVDRILDAGADVVLATGNIESRARERLARADVTAFYEVDDDDGRQVALATGATPVGDLDVLTADHLGFAGSVAQQKFRELTHKQDAPAERTMVFDDLPGETVGTILLRGGTEHALDEVERAVEDSVGVTVAAVEDGVIVPGAGAPEIALARAVRERSTDVAGREQLALEAFADSLETLPRTLAENAGHDVVDALVALRTAHDDGDWAAGLDADTGDVVDAYRAGVMEPYRVKSCALSSAVDAATLVLRIDDLISAGDLTASDDEN
ncbi:Chaperonin GroEL (HSP60 family) [Halomicrobium zhouii]|uniref:Chaperonin GroEL (HSP60 family) n=1 Tax=Halomicrobium zhouii TaxID=767519 RepID=A0A1I6L8J8_9EURY|nr:thermosome subunit alpha [Halomicrobium zhouii]SFR99757.1 Chaperonin GroEL (HSP60 family) [Halomicrobium zhouii]